MACNRIGRPWSRGSDAALPMTAAAPHCRSGPGVRYWAAICVASVFGAGLGDVVSHDLHLGHWRGLLPLGLLFALILRGGRTGRLGAEAAYWLAVVVIRAAATNLADLATHDWRLSNPALVTGLAALLAIAAARPRHPTMGIVMRPGLPATDARYWIALFLAGMLGTVLGDDASGRYGTAGASVLLAAILALLFWLRQRAWIRGSASYWTTLLGARTAGTSLGDLLADRSGLGLAGSTAATGLLLVVLLVGIRPAGVPGRRTRAA